MKKILFFVFTALTFAACEQALVEEQSPICPDVPETITVGFEGGNDTRIQLNEAQKTVWTKDDLVSVFYRSNANQQWKYNGETGARTADLTRVDAGEATEQINRVVVLYPYNESYIFNTETFNVQITLPAEQTYLEDSYGLDGNIMVSSSEFNQFKLKTVYGWLKLQLTGNGEKIKDITVRGNNGEQVAGDVVINTPDATITLAADGDKSDATIFTEVTLDCGEGVELGAEATAFYIALPPQTFAKGLTVEITAIDGSAMTQSTDNEVVIERNHIKPMTAFGYNGIFKPANNEIWYTNGSTTEATTPYFKSAFGSTTIQSNTYDAEKECWVITFDKDVTKIGYEAFYYCESLTSVTIPDSVTTIGKYAFDRCYSLKSVTIPDSVTTIGEGAFWSCYSLTSVTIPNSVTTIVDYAFYGCTSLKSINIPESVTSIGKEVFHGCTGNLIINSKIVEIDYTLYNYPSYYGWLKEAKFTKLTIGDSVTSIGSHAFRGCSSLRSVTIPDSVTTIGDYAFNSCSFTGITIPDSVTTIGDGAFSNCSLTSITIPDSVTSIGETAFGGCDSLTRITIGDSVTSIGSYAFEFCTSLTRVTIPDSVTSIGYHAFYYCSSLTRVYCKATTPPAGGYDMFYLNASGRKIYVPASDDNSIINAYKKASGWSSYKDYIFEEE